MPELSRFFGIIIRMFWEVSVPHHTPHFHAYYQNEVAVYSFDPVELIAGSLPRRQRRFVEAWGNYTKLNCETIGIDYKGGKRHCQSIL